jgi:1-acyl-sn-glycerol-3-phosphate acyltransferase
LSSLTFRAGLGALRRLRDYHKYEAIGIERAMGVQGPVIVALSHSLATYDAGLLGLAGYEATGRLVAVMADRVVFRIPLVRDFLSTMGFVEGSRDTALALLARGEMLGVLPGGMREQLGIRRQKYTVDWKGRYGFVWTALRSGAPVVLAACPRGDDIFEVTDNPLTTWAYDRFHLPVPLFHGRGPTLVPRPVKLWHLLSEPIHATVPPDRVTERDVHAHHRLLSERMAALMKEALDLR